MSTMWLHHSREKGKRPLDLFSSGYPKQGLLVMTKQRFRECGKANAYSASIEFSVSTHGEHIHGRKAPMENSNIDYQAFFNSRLFAHSRTECLPLQNQIFSAHSLIPEPNVLLTSTQLVCTHASESWLCGIGVLTLRVQGVRIEPETLVFNGQPMSLLFPYFPPRSSSLKRVPEPWQELDEVYEKAWVVLIDFSSTCKNQLVRFSWDALRPIGREP